MLSELLVATGMVALTVVIHGWGLALLAMIVRASEGARPLDWMSMRGITFSVGLALGLFLLHGIEIWCYAVLFQALGATSDFRAAVYFSTTTYSAIGFSDADFHPRWLLVAGIEGINGLLLIGWSTAFFVAVMTSMLERVRERPHTRH
ncbi:MAG: ion channel [Pseudomonadota bacterium]